MTNSSRLDEMLARGQVGELQHRAGAEFRSDWIAAHDSYAASRFELQPRGVEGGADSVVFSRQRIRKVRAELGACLMQLLVAVVIRDLAPATAASELGQESRWGAPSLRLALDQVAGVYGYGRSAYRADTYGIDRLTSG